MTGKLCPYCQNRITSGSAVTACPACNTPHHSECWNYNGGCTTFGCRYMPGASAHSSAQAYDAYDDLDIELYPPGGGYPPSRSGHVEQQHYRQSQPRSKDSWLWAIISITAFLGMVAIMISTTFNNPTNVSYMKRAIKCVNQEQYETAKTYCNLAIEQDPECMEAYYLKGTLLLELCNWRHNNIEVWMDQARHGNTERFDAADECFRQCIRFAPTDTTEYNKYLKLDNSEIVSRAYVHLAMTATLRMLANYDANRMNDALLWARIARQYLNKVTYYHLGTEYYELADALQKFVPG